MRQIARFLLGLLLASPWAPLRAQLDPKLQGSSTDFLNLYQQSTNTKVKPEILTVFDFSGSMQAVMYHPLYVNTDTTDSGSTSSMRFTLTQGTGGQNVRTIKVWASGCPQAYATYKFTVNGTGSSTGNTGSQCGTVYTIYAEAYANDNAYASIDLPLGGSPQNPYNNGTAGRRTWYEITNQFATEANAITISPSGPFAAGQDLTLTSYLNTNTTNTDNRRITWIATDGAGYTTSRTVNYSNTSSPFKSTWTWKIPAGGDSAYQVSNISTTATTFTANSSVTFNASLVAHGSNTQLSWSDDLGNTHTGTSWNYTVPAYDSGTPSYVTATLSGSAVGDLSSQILIKPDGSQVTQSDAAAASNSDLYGTSAGALDVRNWVRAASHVRFQATVDTNVLRTVDIPIPWKIMDKNSSGNPLSSMTILDKQIKIAADGTQTTYGSGQNIDMDTTWTIGSGSRVLSGSSSTQTSTTLGMVDFRRTYVDWLFSGKYANGTYAGKYIVFDADNKALAGGQDNVSWGQGFGSAAQGNKIPVPQYKPNGDYDTEKSLDASVNIVPALTRVQAVKRAAIQTWVGFQADVIWAYRFLDDAYEAKLTSLNNNSKNSLSATDPTTTYLEAEDSGWRVLNNTSAQGKTSTSGNSVTGMKRIAGLFANSWTPLTYAMARGLAQFTDPNSVFNAVETGDDAPSQCMNHFLILFTDGIDNNGGQGNSSADTPYVKDGSVNALNGNQQILSHANCIDMPSTGYGFTPSTYWNLYTFAGIAAHMADRSLVSGATADKDYKDAWDPGTTTTTAGPYAFLPFAIKKRASTTFDTGHRITTMTVGVSLGGKYTDSASPKRSLFYAAAVGDPLTPSGNLASFVPFEMNDATKTKRSGSIYFFDATDPTKLVDGLHDAILSAVNTSNINSTANPTTPYIGAALGQEIYIGKFQPPFNGGTFWDGNLLMFGTRLVNNQLKVIDKNGDVTTTLDGTTSQWDTASAMSTKTWSSRNLYTRVPGGTSLVSFTDTGTGYDAIKSYVCQASNNPNGTSYPADSDNQKAIIQFIMGGDTSSTSLGTRPSKNRTNIMGDVIDSSPAAIEYLYSDVKDLLPTELQVSGGNRFRLILVGTNQGWLHAFGEVTTDSEVTSSDKSTKYMIKTGKVAELWAFMPTDFLGYLDQTSVATNAHRFMVDGAPAIYHLDIPVKAGAGNGVVDKTERAIAIIGLGKGGRSYYALDIHNPFTPALKWSLVPDEASSLTSSNIQSSSHAPSLDTVKSVVGKMGYSSCTAGIGRITYDGVLRDAVFLGGGFSRPEIEANFPDSDGKATPLGRSSVALDVNSGKFLAVQDLSAQDSNGNPVHGPVAKGVVPFEFFINSGMAQRAYFLDYWGGLWAWGSTTTDDVTTSATHKYRIDTSELTGWGLRYIAQDQNGGALKDSSGNTTSHYREALYTTLPAPFRVGIFPGTAMTSTSPVPAVVGVAMESGDRNNPLDQNYATGARPDNHRIAVVFDRQDSALWGSTVDPIIIKDQTTPASATDSGSGQVMDAYPGGSSLQAGNAVISPGASAYYLAPRDTSGDLDIAKTKFGYYRKFPDVASGTNFVSKGINSPIVVAGSLFYSYFTPKKADVCTGGSGNTYTNMMCDVLNPIVSDSRTNVACASGEKISWYGPASDFIPVGTRGVIQIGTEATTDSSGKVTTFLGAQTVTGQSKGQYPKPRVWRTVH